MFACFSLRSSLHSSTLSPEGPEVQNNHGNARKRMMCSHHNPSFWRTHRLFRECIMQLPPLPPPRPLSAPPPKASIQTFSLSCLLGCETEPRGGFVSSREISPSPFCLYHLPRRGPPPLMKSYEGFSEGGLEFPNRKHLYVCLNVVSIFLHLGDFFSSSLSAKQARKEKKRRR